MTMMAHVTAYQPLCNIYFLSTSTMAFFVSSMQCLDYCITSQLTTILSTYLTRPSGLFFGIIFRRPSGASFTVALRCLVSASALHDLVLGSDWTAYMRDLLISTNEEVSFSWDPAAYLFPSREFLPFLAPFFRILMSHSVFS
jgi:hypothetical protein